MGTILLLRHGRSTANGDGVLAGRTPGVGLDPAGLDQAAAVVDRLAGVPIDRIVSSPQERCRLTVSPLAHARGLSVDVDERLAEVDYGDWAGRRLTDLSDEPLWKAVQWAPTTVTFPGGEAMVEAASRAVRAARELAPAAGDGGITVLCTHGDIISAILADALGVHFDLFQRIVVSPASASVISYTPLRPLVLCSNHTGAVGPVVAGLPGAAGATGDDVAVGGATA